MGAVEGNAFQQLCCRFKSENGSVLVEVAFALPILVLLLFGGLDAGHYLQLIQKTEQAAIVIVDALTNDPDFSTEDMLDSLALSESILTLGEMSPHVKISVTSYKLSSDGMQEIYFDKSEGAVPVLCEKSGISPRFEALFEEPSAPAQYYFQVSLCVVAADAFYLSTFLPLKNTAISAVAFGLGKQWANIPELL